MAEERGKADASAAAFGSDANIPIIERGLCVRARAACACAGNVCVRGHLERGNSVVGNKFQDYKFTLVVLLAILHW